MSSRLLVLSNTLPRGTIPLRSLTSCLSGEVLRTFTDEYGGGIGGRGFFEVTDCKGIPVEKY